MFHLCIWKKMRFTKIRVELDGTQMPWRRPIKRHHFFGCNDLLTYFLWRAFERNRREKIISRKKKKKKRKLFHSKWVQVVWHSASSPYFQCVDSNWFNGLWMWTMRCRESVAYDRKYFLHATKWFMSCRRKHVQFASTHNIFFSFAVCSAADGLKIHFYAICKSLLQNSSPHSNGTFDLNSNLFKIFLRMHSVPSPNEQNDKKWVQRRKMRKITKSHSKCQDRHTASTAKPGQKK